MTRCVSMIAMNLVTPKAAGKLQLMYNILASEITCTTFKSD